MIIATFNEATGWVDKKITFEDDAFTLEGHGAISAADVLVYDSHGHLQWVHESTRAWVRARAQARRKEPALSSAARKVYDRHGGPRPIDFVVRSRPDSYLVAAADRCILVKPRPPLLSTPLSELGSRGSSQTASRPEYTEFRYADITEITVHQWGPSRQPVIEVVTPAYPAISGGARERDPSGLPNCLVVPESALLDGDGPAHMDELFRRAGLKTTRQPESRGRGAFSSQLPPTRSGFSPLAPLTIIGILLAVGGVCVALFYLAIFDTSVYAGSGVGYVNNIGLMADRQNGIIVGIGMAILGGILMLIGLLHPFGRDDLASAREPAPVSKPARVPPNEPKLHLAVEPSQPPLGSVADELAKLADLHAKGSITDDEFAAFKAKLME